MRQFSSCQQRANEINQRQRLRCNSLLNVEQLFDLVGTLLDFHYYLVAQLKHLLQQHLLSLPALSIFGHPSAQFQSFLHILIPILITYIDFIIRFQMGGSQSTPFAKQLENYRVITKNQENNTTFLSHKETENEYLLRQSTFNDQNQYARNLEAHKKRCNLEPDHLTHLIRVEGTEIDHLCSNIYKVYAIWEYPYRFLSEEISQRAAQNRKFQQKELWSIFASCIFGMSTLQENKISHECLTTKSILLDNQGIVKVCDPLASNSLKNFDRIYNSRLIAKNSNIQQSVYLSPQQCESLDNRNSYTNPYKNDIYAMGLILLECGLLKQQYSVYKNDFERINYNQLDISLNKFGQEYGKQFKDTLQMMLKTDEKDRPDWLNLRQFARKQNTDNQDSQALINSLKNSEPQRQPVTQLHYQPPKQYFSPTNYPTYSNSQPPHISELHHRQPNRFNAPIAQSRFPNIPNRPETFAKYSTNPIKPQPPQITNYQRNFNPPMPSGKITQPYPNYHSHFLHESAKKQPFQSSEKKNTSHVNSNNESLFTDPKLLMMMRGEVPYNKYMQNNPISTDFSKNVVSNSPPPPVSHRPSSEHYQAGYLFSNSNQYQGSSSNQKQLSAQSHQNHLVRQYQNQPLVSSERQSIDENKQKLSKPTIQSNKAPSNQIQNQQHFEKHPQQDSLQNQKEDEELQYVIQEFRQGSRYEGYKLNDQRHGKGKFYYLDGGLYDGDWKFNKMDGEGALYYQSGKIAFNGGWRDDKFQGFGVLYNEYPIDLSKEGEVGFDYTDFDGIDDYWQKYEGLFEEDFKKGKGKLYLANGEWFEGHFDDDMVQGEGEFHCLDGRVVKGTWRSNHLEQ